MTTQIFKIGGQFDKPTDKGYHDAHAELARRLRALVRDSWFQGLARQCKVENWQDAAHQACENYARHLLLEADEIQMESDVKRAVGAEYRKLIGAPAMSGVSHMSATH